ncbi:MAG: DUF1028 domain-containing protein [Gammaproteobacteria bacterium]|nr:DUF1028 domain-containing protein [Gammaproteobacteria bacterium]
MTFSIAAKCHQTEQYGIAISSSSICVASRCPWARSGVGAVSTQNITLPSLGPAILDQMEQGKDVKAAMLEVMSNEVNADYRQVIAVDNQGSTSGFNGSKSLGINNISRGKNCIAAGNLLSAGNVTTVMIDEFLDSGKTLLADRLLDAMDGGLKAGGEAGPIHSAGLLVVGGNSWPLVDLRVDWTDHNPLAELRELWDRYAPQMADYISRANNPSSAPGYGVPGE